MTPDVAIRAAWAAGCAWRDQRPSPTAEGLAAYRRAGDTACARYVRAALAASDAVDWSETAMAIGREVLRQHLASVDVPCD